MNAPKKGAGIDLSAIGKEKKKKERRRRRHFFNSRCERERKRKGLRRKLSVLHLQRSKARKKEKHNRIMITPLSLNSIRSARRRGKTEKKR